jgi:glycosyltransferase involved in cell wall biosynthesis
MVTSEFPPPRRGLEVAGVGFSSFSLCKALIKRGHEVTVLTRGSGKGPRFETIENINIYRIPYFPLYPFHIKFHGIFVNKVFRSIEHDFDLVHIQLPVAPLINTPLPTIVTIHSIIKTRAKRSQHNSLTRRMADQIYSAIISSLEQEILQNADLITTVSSKVAEGIKNLYHIDPKIIKVIRNVVDTEFFAPKKPSKNTQYILWSGRMIYAKGLLDLLECAKYVCQHHPHVSFILAGAGPLRNHLKKEIDNLGLEKKVILVGQLCRENLLTYYQNSTLFVLPSHHESFPNVILEAMACGIPTVACDVGDVETVVKDGETGFLVPVKNPRAMAQRIIELLNDESLRKRMGEASRTLIEQHYSWDNISSKMIDCYKLVVGQSS